MATLYLKFKESVLKEFPLKDGITTIGRAESNNIPIDNLAVSGNHARIIGEAHTFIIEDLGSTNGTYIDDRRITRQKLLHNTIIAIGKHSLVFVDPDTILADDSDRTVVKKRPAGSAPATAAASPRQQPSVERTIIRGAVLQQPLTAPAENIGILTVLEGSAKDTVILLDKRLVSIGKSAEAGIRLDGFFAPRVAALINKSREGYFITPASRWRKLLVNGTQISAAHPLKPSDVVQIASFRARFSFLEG
ncbi:MAG: FHA domain-containing protein [Geobacteraceae bacterium]|nr:FHA domain-containing protein [Geobacteraceae bacterium]